MEPARRTGSTGRTGSESPGLEEVGRGVAFEGFDGFVFGEAEGVVGLGEAAAAVLGALPEFAAVFAEEEGLVFLRLVAENRAAAAEDFLPPSDLASSSSIALRISVAFDA